MDAGNIPEERRSHTHRGGSLKSRMSGTNECMVQRRMTEQAVLCPAKMAKRHVRGPFRYRLAISLFHKHFNSTKQLFNRPRVHDQTYSRVMRYQSPFPMWISLPTVTTVSPYLFNSVP
jgi:hypothetical protein